MPRTSRSSAASIACAAPSDSAFAVSRTFNPSMPLARKASVGLPTSSKRSISDARVSARPDSLSPHVRKVRLTITAVSPDRSRRSGMIARASISFIS